MNLLEGILADNERNLGKVHGITTGVVKENFDKENPGRVKVEMHLGETGKNVTGWIPVMCSYAGSEYGNYWMPEIGQEVVIGFHFGERDYPIVLGCLWDKKNQLPKETANKNNTIKKFTTKGGCQIIFNDEKGKEKIEIETPGHLSITMEDEKKLIQIKDEKGDNTIILDCDKGNLSFQAKTKLEFKVGKESILTMDDKAVKIKNKTIEQEGTEKVAVNGQNINLSAKSNVDLAANANVSVKGNSGVKINSSGITEVKGSMVKIN